MTVGGKGVRVLFGLGKLVVTMYVASAVCAFCWCWLRALALFRHSDARVLPRRARAISDRRSPPPRAKPRCRWRSRTWQGFGVPKHIVGFVIPTGYSFNLVGSALYLSVASIFVAQAAGMHLTVGQQLIMMLTLMLTSKGVAGVPRGGLVILAGDPDHLPPAAGGRGRAAGRGRHSGYGAHLASTCWATAWPARWWRGGRATSCS